MSLTVIALCLLAALAGGWLLWRGRSAPSPRPAAAARPPRMPVPVVARAADSAPPAPPVAPAPAEFFTPPPALVDGFDWHLAATLDDARRQALVATLGRIRRPPAALHQMLSPQFLDRASSQALSELINGEAQLAAKVLATVNAPLYGLSRPVSSIGQAVTFLGLNTVRSIVLRDLLDGSFAAQSPTANPALKQATQELWNASALASELCNRLSSKLGMADAGALVAQVLLSFLGHLATTTLLAERTGAAPPAAGNLLARTRAAQDTLGLGPAEIGGLLLQAWGLPATIVDGVRAIDRVLVTPAGALPASAGAQLALAHLCARLGEQLAAADAPAAASPGGLAGLSAGLLEAEENFHLRAHLATPVLARLGDHLQASDLALAMQGLQQGLRGPR